VKYKTWNLEDLPMLPERLKLSVIKQSGSLQISSVFLTPIAGNM
jgi:hypothetical protein